MNYVIVFKEKSPELCLATSQLNLIEKLRTLLGVHL